MESWPRLRARESVVRVRAAFQGKLRGKLLGTLGLFVSVNGFAVDAPSALVFGKEIDVILADRSFWKLVTALCLSWSMPTR
ncbi:MAG TPA: hypothetical protein VH165_20145 [Kofleriaceae bacterium]|jgi:hypothetical protein|nr:hypothetical protein [Kofleriaceae bacterium]